MSNRNAIGLLFSPLGKLAGRAMYFTCVNLSCFLFLLIARSSTISGSTGPILTIFSPNDRYLFVDDRSGPLFNDSSRDVAMATNFVLYRTRSLGAEVSQDPLDRFSQSLHHMDLKFFLLNGRWSIRPSISDILRDVDMATNLVEKWGKIAYPPALIALSFRNGMG